MALIGVFIPAISILIGKISSKRYWPLVGITKETLFGVGGKPILNKILPSPKTKPKEIKLKPKTIPALISECLKKHSFSLPISQKRQTNQITSLVTIDVAFFKIFFFL